MTGGQEEVLLREKDHAVMTGWQVDRSKTLPYISEQMISRAVYLSFKIPIQVIYWKMPFHGNLCFRLWRLYTGERLLYMTKITRIYCSNWINFLPTIPWSTDFKPSGKIFEPIPKVHPVKSACSTNFKLYRMVFFFLFGHQILLLLHAGQSTSMYREEMH